MLLCRGLFVVELMGIRYSCRYVWEEKCFGIGVWRGFDEA